MADFPTALPSFPSVTGSEFLGNAGGGLGVATLFSNIHTNVVAVATKIGSGSSTPTNNAVLVGNGSGTSAWATTLAGLTLTSPTINNPTLNTNTINEYGSGSGVTIDGVLLKDNKMNGSYITDSTIGQSQVISGMPVQVVYSSSSAVGSGSTVLPVDDTIPQNTEGDQYLTCAITPKSTTNVLVIEATFFGAGSVAGWISGALFQGTTANALAASTQYQATANGGANIKVKHVMTAGTTSSTTFKLRAGLNGAGTFTFNGESTNRQFGAIPKSFITITEYKA